MNCNIVEYVSDRITSQKTHNIVVNDRVTHEKTCNLVECDRFDYIKSGYIVAISSSPRSSNIGGKNLSKSPAPLPLKIFLINGQVNWVSQVI